MSFTNRASKFLSAALAAGLALFAATSADAQVRISQIYGGGGNTSAQWDADYVELFNAGSTPVNMTGWSLQYAAAGGNFGTSTLKQDFPSGATIQPNGYYLIRAFRLNTPTVGAPLSPAADFVPTAPVGGTGVGINLAAAAGKVAIVNNTTLLAAAACPTLPANPPAGMAVVDFVGYGTVNCPAANTVGTAPASNTTAVFRADGGCRNSGNTNADFFVAAPVPRSSVSPTNSCAVTNPSGTGSASNPSPCRGFTVTLTFNVTSGTNPPSTGINVTGNDSAIGGSGAFNFTNTGGNTWTANVTVANNSNTGNRTIPITITDAQGRTGGASIVLNVQNCNPTGTFGSNLGLAGCTGQAVVFTVAVNPGQQPVSTGITVQADFLGIGGPLTTFVDDGSNGDQTAGDNIFSTTFTIPAQLGTVTSIPVIISDAQGRVTTFNASYRVAQCSAAPRSVVINQIYGGGGNSGATLKDDFVELFNATDQPVSVDGWTLQYGSSGGAINQILSLSGTIPPGGYYLAKFAGGGGGTVDLPTPDAESLSIGLGSTGGKVALVSDGSIIVGSDCGQTSIVDLVAYGTGASCFAGIGPAPSLTNTTAVFRREGGCQNFRQNAIDFFVGGPLPRNSATPPAPCGFLCRIDFNGDSVVNTDDISDFITDYFTEPTPPGPGGFSTPCTSAPAPYDAQGYKVDFNADCIVNTDDISDYITAYFSGC